MAEKLKACFVDSFACALSSADEDAVRIARETAVRLAPGPAALFGSAARASAELAGFANGVAIRYLDWNDVYLTPSGGMHPSDSIGALLALAQQERSSGRVLLGAVAVAYEVSCRLRDATHAALRAGGWDGVTLVAIATACGAAALLGLDAPRTRHAIAIAGAACAAVGQTRAGEFSMWKGAAGADAARKGILGAALAASGMTGPARIFEGEFGLQRLVTGDFAWPGDESWRTPRVQLKAHGSLAATHAGIEAALELRARGVRAADVERLTLHTFSFLARATTPEKWRPVTRETADHSLPYCVAAALLDGQVGAQQFRPARIGAADIRALMARAEVAEDPAYSESWPDTLVTRVTARLRSGAPETAEGRVAASAPPVISRAGVQRKLNGATAWRGPDYADALARPLWDLERVPDVSALDLGAPA